MIAPDNPVSTHYTVPGLGQRILAALEASGKDLDGLTVDDLAAVDEFHIRGRAATEELAAWVGDLPGDARILDVGCGLGGTCRYLAARFGAHVTGVDLTEESCRTAAMLSERVGLADRTTFRRASALELPYGGASFDLVVTEHAQMNIADKSAFYRELARVLKPGGLLAFHDIFAGDAGAAGDAGDLHFPVPWAADASISHLVRGEEVRALLASLGLVERQWHDRSAESADFFAKVLGRVRTQGWPPLGLHLLTGADALVKFDNVRRNAHESRIRVIAAVLGKP